MGLSKWIGVGNRTVLEFADYLDYLARDEDTKTIGIFMEGIENGRRFYQVAKEVAKAKPIVIYKVGESKEVDRAARTHTGSMAGSKAIHLAAFRQAGLVEVSSPREVAIALKALNTLPLPQGERLCILTFTAGPSIVAMDKVLGGGWTLPSLRDGARNTIYKVIGEKTPVDIGNPVDLAGPGFLPEVYSRVAEVLVRQSFNAYLFLWGHNRNIRVVTEELIQIKKKMHRPIVIVLLGVAEELREEMELMEKENIPVFTTPEDGAMALNFLLMRKRLLEA